MTKRSSVDDVDTESPTVPISSMLTLTRPCPQVTLVQFPLHSIWYFTGMFEIFGKENVTVHEFVNPSNYHFRSFNVNQSTCEAHNHTWHGGSTWYPGMMWRVCHCPVCGQAVGWEWRQEVGGAPDTDQSEWVGLRMGTVSDWSDYLLGPLSDLPQLLQSVGK